MLRTTFPRGLRESASSNQSSPDGAISVAEVVVRPVIMALFPAFAGVSEASGDGASRKGKPLKRVEKDTDEINSRFSGPGRVLFL